ncbi:MAG: amidohydrolase family protein [bacterium]
MNILIKNINKIYENTVIEDNSKSKSIISIKDNIIDGLYNSMENIDDEGSYDIIIDAKDKVALPGLINTHTHAAMTLLRGYADDLPLQKWLQDKIWPFEASLNSEDIYWGSTLAIMEMISTGTTAFTDMYFQMDVVAEVVEETGIRAVLSEGLIEANDGQKGLDMSIEFCKKWNKQADGRITTMLAPHAPYTCSRTYLEEIMNISDKNNLTINIHLSETRTEYNNSLNDYQMTPVAYLNSFGFFERPILAAHCVYLSDEDINILAKKNIAISYNPSSNMKLGSGIARIVDMLNKDILVCFGTDGTSSNNNLDLIEEARIGSYLQKVNSNDPTVLDIKTLLQMLTNNAAQALGLNKLGKIQEGYKADIILIDINNNSHFYPHHNNLSNIFYSGSGRDVDTVIINGKLIYQNNDFLTIDKEKVYYQVEEILKEKENVLKDS